MGANVLKRIMAAALVSVAAAGVVAVAAPKSGPPLMTELHRRGEMYFDPATNKPYSGPMTPSDCRECGWSGSAEIKDGKLHGKYSEAWEEGSVDGTYKDGKKDGEWKTYTEEGTKVEIYKDGVLQPVGGAGK